MYYIYIAGSWVSNLMIYIYGDLWSSRGKLWIVSTSLGLRGDWIFDKNVDGDLKSEAYNTIINDETDCCCNEQNVIIVAMIVITCNNWLIPLVFESRVWFIHRERGRNQCGIASMACLVESSKNRQFQRLIFTWIKVVPQFRIANLVYI